MCSFVSLKSDFIFIQKSRSCWCLLHLKAPFHTHSLGSKVSVSVCVCFHLSKVSHQHLSHPSLYCPLAPPQARARAALLTVMCLRTGMCGNQNHVRSVCATVATWCAKRSSARTQVTVPTQSSPTTSAAPSALTMVGSLNWTVDIFLMSILFVFCLWTPFSSSPRLPGTSWGKYFLGILNINMCLLNWYNLLFTSIFVSWLITLFNVWFFLFFLIH